MTTDGGDTILSFTSNGTLTVSDAGAFTFLIVGGGGSGGDGTPTGGGGGAGGVVFGNLTLDAGSYAIVIGEGALNPGSDSNVVGNNGGDTVFNGTIIGLGGGGGGGNCNAGPAGNGGSGGGEEICDNGIGNSTQPSYAGLSSFGNNGGHADSSTSAGGGGGAGSDGEDYTLTTKAGDGGAGYNTTIRGFFESFAGGGGGGSFGFSPGLGRDGGGDGCGPGLGCSATNAGANTGGGGGGTVDGLPGNGGSGILIVRFTPTAPPAPSSPVNFFDGAETGVASESWRGITGGMAQYENTPSFAMTDAPSPRVVNITNGNAIINNTDYTNHTQSELLENVTYEFWLYDLNIGSSPTAYSAFDQEGTFTPYYGFDIPGGYLINTGAGDNYYGTRVAGWHKFQVYSHNLGGGMVDMDFYIDEQSVLNATGITEPAQGYGLGSGNSAQTAIFDNVSIRAGMPVFTGFSGPTPPPSNTTYSLSITMNDTNTSSPISDFCVGVGTPSSCTTNGTVVLTGLSNGSVSLSYTATGYVSDTTSATISGHSEKVIQATPTPVVLPKDFSSAINSAVLLVIIAMVAFFLMSVSGKISGETQRKNILIIFVVIAILLILTILSTLL